MILSNAHIWYGERGPSCCLLVLIHYFNQRHNKCSQTMLQSSNRCSNRVFKSHKSIYFPSLFQAWSPAWLSSSIAWPSRGRRGNRISRNSGNWRGTARPREKSREGAGPAWPVAGQGPRVRSSVPGRATRERSWARPSRKVSESFCSTTDSISYFHILDCPFHQLLSLFDTK